MNAIRWPSFIRSTLVGVVLQLLRFVVKSLALICQYRYASDGSEHCPVMHCSKRHTAQPLIYCSLYFNKNIFIACNTLFLSVSCRRNRTIPSEQCNYTNCFINRSIMSTNQKYCLHLVVRVRVRSCGYVIRLRYLSFTMRTQFFLNKTFKWFSLATIATEQPI